MSERRISNTFTQAQALFIKSEETVRLALHCNSHWNSRLSGACDNVTILKFKNVARKMGAGWGGAGRLFLVSTLR